MGDVGGIEKMGDKEPLKKVDLRSKKEIRADLKKDLKKVLEINMFNLGFNEVEEVPVIKTGFDNIDFILGGGIAKGDWVEIFGETGCGKTTFALQVINEFLSTNKEAIVLYVDQEMALDFNWVKLHITGENLKRVEIVQPDFLEVMGDILLRSFNKNYFNMIVIDTWAAALPRAMFEDGSNQIGLKAIVEGKLILRLNPYMKRLGVPVIVLNQLRSRKSGKYFIEDSAGGKAQKYMMTERIFFHKPVKDELGYSVLVETKKNRHASPFQFTNLRFERDVKRFDEKYSLFENFYTHKKMIKQGGGWFRLDGCNKKFRKDALMDYLWEHKDEFNKKDKD